MLDTTGTSWVEEYLDSILAQPDNIDNHIAKKLPHINRPFYKYYSVTDSFDEYDHNRDYGIKDFEEDTLYFQSPQKFNDPFDCNFGYSKYDLFRYILLSKDMNKNLSEDFKVFINLLFSQMHQKNGATNRSFYLFDDILKNMLPKPNFDKINEVLENAISDFKKSNDMINNTFGIFCLTEHMNSPLMWSHYANKHNGFCLEYDFYCNAADNIYLNIIQQMILPVIYKTQRPNFIDIALKNNGFAEHYKQNNEITIEFKRDLIYSMLIKSEDWSYEKEWRIILTNVKDRLVKGIKANGIYLGARLNESAKETLINIAKRKNIPIYQMMLNQSVYKLEWYQVE